MRIPACCTRGAHVPHPLHLLQLQLLTRTTLILLRLARESAVPQGGIVHVYELAGHLVLQVAACIGQWAH